MKNTYTWSVDSLVCVPSIEGKTNVVSFIYWRLKGENGVNTASSYGVQPIEYVTGSSFTEYSQLTEGEIINWLKTLMGNERIAQIESILDNMLTALANPPIIASPLPWVKA